MVGKGGTTSGHGIFSQYRPEHMKQWILGESKSQRGRSEFGSKSLSELRELQKSNEGESYKRIPDSADFIASTSGPIDVSKTSEDLFGDKTWQGAMASQESIAESAGQVAEDRKEFLSLPPHLVHHHHFGWQHSQNDQERIVGTLSNRESYRKYGDAMSYCQLINTKHSLISTRKS